MPRLDKSQVGFSIHIASPHKSLNQLRSPTLRRLTSRPHSSRTPKLVTLSSIIDVALILCVVLLPPLSS